MERSGRVRSARFDMTLLSYSGPGGDSRDTRDGAKRTIGSAGTRTTVHFGVHFGHERSQHHRVPPSVPLAARGSAGGRNRHYQAHPPTNDRNVGGKRQQ